MRIFNQSQPQNTNISYYLANTLVYLALEKRLQGNKKTLERSLAYLHKIYSHPYEPRRQVWNKAQTFDVGYEFKTLSDVIRFKHTSEDIEKAIICLMTLSDLILNKSDVMKVIHTFRSRQIMHELKHGQELSILDESE